MQLIVEERVLCFGNLHKFGIFPRNTVTKLRQFDLHMTSAVYRGLSH